MSIVLLSTVRKLVVIIVVAGCGTATPTTVPAGPSGSPTPASSDAPPPVSSPTQPPDLKAAAASAYLKAVKTYNAALNEIRKKPCGVSTLKAQHNCARKWSTALETFIAAIQAIEFPAKYEADAHALVKASTAVDALLRSEIGEKSLYRIFNYWDPKLDKATQKGREASALLRADLGLPPVPTN